MDPQQAPPAQTTKTTCGDAVLDQALEVFFMALSQMDPAGRTLEGSAADELVDRWLRRGRYLWQLRDRLKAEKAPAGWVHIWAGEIDYFFSDHSRRRLERDHLSHEVGKLVRELNQKANDPGIYKRLVALGCEYKHDLKSFQRHLRQGKLHKTRISEIIRLVKSKHTAKQFIAGTLSVRRALFLARSTPRRPGPAALEPSPTTGLGAGNMKDHWPTRLTTTMAALLDLAGLGSDQKAVDWQMQVGLYHLSITFAAPVS